MPAVRHRHTYAYIQAHTHALRQEDLFYGHKPYSMDMRPTCADRNKQQESVNQSEAGVTRLLARETRSRALTSLGTSILVHSFLMFYSVPARGSVGWVYLHCLMKRCHPFTPLYLRRCAESWRVHLACTIPFIFTAHRCTLLPSYCTIFDLACIHRCQ